MAGALLGGSVHNRLPEHHLSGESKDMVKIGVGFISTLAALVLGLLVASAKSSFDTKSDEVQQAATKIVLLDRNLRQLGPDAKPVRELVRDLVVAKHNLTWVTDESRASSTGPGPATPFKVSGEEVRDRVGALSPANDAQRAAQARALQLVDEVLQMRWLLIEQSTAAPSMPLLVVLVAWLATISGCLGLYAPRNGTVFAVTLLCALSASAAIFLILEMYTPFSGLMRISDAPMRTAINYLNQ
jgi:hypothetical protein